MFEAILSAGAGSSPPEPEPGRAQTADKPSLDAGVDEFKEAEQTLETVLDDSVPFESQLAGQEGRDQPAVIERLAADDERAVEFRERFVPSLLFPCTSPSSALPLPSCSSSSSARPQVDLTRALLPADRMRTWFFHADWAAIKRDNMLDWIAWSSFRSVLPSISGQHTRHVWLLTNPLPARRSAPSHTALTTPAQREALEHALDLMERRTGKVFPPGRDEKVRVMRLTLGALSRRRCLLAQVSRADAV
jgi:hypothetical protein